MHVRPFEYGSPEYAAACELRRRFLREPLGLPLSEADVAGEDAQHHFGLFTEAPGDERSLVGTLIGKPDPDDPRAVRLRQVVIDPAHRGAGHGRLLMERAERSLVEAGHERFILFARDEAATFYDLCGYQRTGATAELIGLPHLRMEKRR